MSRGSTSSVCTAKIMCRMLELDSHERLTDDSAIVQYPAEES